METKPSSASGRVLEAKDNWLKYGQETRDQPRYASLKSEDQMKDQDSSSPSVLERLNSDYEHGRISIDQYMSYKAWTVFAPNRLFSTEYSLSSEELMAYRKCGSMILLEIKRNWHKLSPDAQSQLLWLLKRPTDSNWPSSYGGPHVLPQLYTSPSGHFVLHWTNGTDGGRAEDTATLTYVQTFAGIFDNVRNSEINTRGYLAPPDDTNNPPNDVNNRNPDGGYDVFVYNMSIYGLTYAEQTAAPSISHISVDNDYQGFPGTPLGCMQVTAAHEFFHAIQFCYDLNDVFWWYEATATYMEDEAYPDVNDIYQYLPAWFDYCDTHGLESTTGSHVYGDFIFAKYLSERENFGDDVIKEIWTEMQVTNGLTAINNVLTSKGSSLVSEFNKFTIANFFLEDMYADGEDYRNAVTGTTKFDGVYLEYKYKEATNGLPFTIDNTNVNWDAWMDKWGTDYITVAMSGVTQNYIITFDGLDHTTHYDVSLVTKVSGDIPRSRDFALNAYKEGRMELSYNPAYMNVTLVIRNSADTSTARPSWRVTIAPKGNHQVTFYTIPALDFAAITLDGNTYTNDEIGNYNSDDYTATANPPNANYEFDHWEYSGSLGSGVYVPNINNNPTTVQVRGNGWLRAAFQKTKYTVTAHASGLPYSFYSTHVYVDDVDQGQPYLYDGNSRMFTYAVGETHTISVHATVQGSTAERRYYCPSNSTTVNTDETIVFEYNEEYKITFDQQDCGGTPHVTVDNVTYSLPYDLWLVANVEHTFNYESLIAGDTGVQYALSSATYTSPHTFTYPATVIGYYRTQYYITINSAHGTSQESQWVNEGSFLTVSVTSPTETVEDQSRWICTGYKVDEGPLESGKSYSFWSVSQTHKIEFYWVQQFWLQVEAGIAGLHAEGTGWYDANTSPTISVTAPYQPSSMHKFIFISWASTGTNTAQITDQKSSNTMVIIDNYYSVEAEWQEQWYITVVSERGDPTPSQWVNASKSFSVSVTSPTDDDGEGNRYRCTKYTIDNEDAQEGASFTFTNVQSSHTIMFQWATQYQLTVNIDPAGLSPQPTASTSGPWHDEGTTVTLTAQSIDGYTFDHWSVDGANQGNGISSITVYMFEPHTTIAYYKPAAFQLQPSLIPVSIILVVVILVAIGAILLLRRRK